MASIWKGSLSFGLVNCPVSMVSAVSDGERVAFNEVCPEHRCKAKRGPSVCSVHGHPVPQVAKGYDLGDGTFMIMAKEELESVQVPSSAVMDIQEFVPLDAIDPRYFEKPYWLVPEKNGAQAYALIVEALRQKQLVGLGLVTTRGRSNWMAVRAFADTEHLALYALRFEDELIPESDLPALTPVEVKKPLVDMAVKLLEAQTTEFDPSKYTNEYQARLRAVVDAKIAGRTEREVAIPVVADTAGANLEAVLQASLDREHQLIESLTRGLKSKAD